MIKGQKKISNSNAGLHALHRQLDRLNMLALNGRATSADVPLATDGIAIAFVDGITSGRRASTRDQMQTILGPGWVFRNDSFDDGGVRFSGLTALPPVEKIPSVGKAWDLARRLAALDGVNSAIPLIAQVAPNPMPDREAKPFSAADEDVPFDAARQRVWHLRALKVEEAWDCFTDKGTPGQGVMVAVVDTGYTDHPEILDCLTRETGQPHRVSGVDLLDGEDPRDSLDGHPPLAFPSHGTSVASVIASRISPSVEGNQTVDGIAPGAQILPVRVTTNVALLLPNKITPGIRKAVDAGANVINVSLGLPYYWPALHAAVRYATEQGVIVVAASGNYWPSVVYPARFPEVLAAANSSWQSREWLWASAGPAVDVIAPGVGIWRAYSKKETGQIEYCAGPSTGTTYAAACCSSLAALWLSYHGGRETLIQYYQGDKRRISQAFHYLIRTTAKVLPGVNVDRYGAGLPQADKLLEARLPTPQELDRDAERLHLQLMPASAKLQMDSSTDTKMTLLPDLSLDLSEQEPVSAEVYRLLGLDRRELPPDGLVREVSFHLASRLGLHEDLLNGRVYEVRQSLLRSKHLSDALRKQLEWAAKSGLIETPLALAVPERTVPDPANRSLRVYAFDPSLSSYLRSVSYNLVKVQLPWEKLDEGPVGEYLEVVDIDPASQAAYLPVALDDPRLLATDGVDPDEADPWFHQQTVYAVAMKTISHFEAALGRPAMWRINNDSDPESFCRRLRIYPHALRQRNAYYSQEKRALLFGYFRSPGQDGAPTGPMVFSCLSYDIIAHETTHALLDGMYHYFSEDTNVDMLAFHEAFADIVALFQHFTHPEVLRAAIGETRGDLEAESLMGKLAQQFGDATGHRGALRDAIGQIRDGKWQRRQPDPDLLAQTEYQRSPHLRGSILVAAVFDAFLKIYKRRTELTIRVATGGSGILPPGNIAADLAEALSREAAKTARQVLNLCVRALDYLPPVDITFGEYLRAAITADRQLVPNDPLGYRVAFVEAFRAWGIQPEGLTTVTPESLCWSPPEGIVGQFTLSVELLDTLNRLLPAWRVSRSRKKLHEETNKAKNDFRKELSRLSDRKKNSLGSKIGIDLAKEFEVHTLRPATTVGPDGSINPMVVVTLIQEKIEKDKPMIRTGSTLLFSRGNGRILFAIHKRDRRGIRADELASHERFRLDATAERDPYHISSHLGEPFAALHLTGHV